MITINPSAEFCFGRDTVVQQIYRNAINQKSVLLFGGRQSGKSTILLRLEKEFSPAVSVSIAQVSETILPVYTQLAGAGELSTPASFFKRIIDAAVHKCIQCFDHVNLQTNNLPSRVKPMTGVDGFRADIDYISEVLKPAQVEFLFLIDEAGRLNRLEERIGVKDNLFSILYGEINLRCYMVFSGAQELFEFIADQGSSPIGARATAIKVNSLDLKAVQAMVNAVVFVGNSEERESMAANVFQLTGGHAGLTASIVRDTSNQINPTFDVENHIQGYIQSHQMLFRIWRERLSPAGQILHDRLILNEALKLDEIHSDLAKQGFPLNLREQAIDEIEFTGIGTLTGVIPTRQLEVSNYLYVLATKPSVVITDTKGQVQAQPSITEKIRTLVNQAMSLIQEINTIYNNKATGSGYNFIFEPNNRHHEIYQDLTQVCDSRADFSDFCASLYLILFETTAHYRGKDTKKAYQLERLPIGFRKEETIIQFVDALRHDFGKGHLTERTTFTLGKNAVNSANVLNHYLGHTSPPDEAKYVVLQEKILVDVVDYLVRLKKNV